MIIKEFFSFFIPKARLNKSLRILITVNTIMVFIIGLFAPFYAVFVQDLGGSTAFAGFSWAILSIVAGALILLFSRWELKMKEQELLIALGYALRGIVFLSFAYMQSIPQLILTQVVWGVAVAFSQPAFDADYSIHTSKSESIGQWGDWEGIQNIAVGIAALVGGVLIQAFGFQSVFLIMAGISMLLALYIWQLPRDVL
jgi:predicted MFS family arabinose efflux permease